MRIRHLLHITAFLLLMAGTAQAITISATPNPATAGQPVLFTIGTSFVTTVPTSCSLTVDYGDGAIQAGIIPAPGTSTLTVSHTYAASGSFQAVVQSSGCGAIAPQPAPPDPASTTVVIEEFGITRMELAFPDGRGELTVRRNDQGVRARATIATTGTGRLQGYWEVDGRPLIQVDRYVIYGQTIVVDTPAVPPLPTFDPGYHILRFVVTSPALPFPTPTLVYNVTPEEGRPIQLQSPLPEALLPFAQVRFAWDARTGAGHYELQVTAMDGSKVFSALTRSPEYVLTDLALRTYFTPGARYLWRVQAVDADGRLAGESTPSPFAFQGEAAAREGGNP